MSDVDPTKQISNHAIREFLIQINDKVLFYWFGINFRKHKLISRMTRNEKNNNPA